MNTAEPRTGRLGTAIDVHAALGRVGLPAPIAELASREWDAIVVGGGHNGLTAAAYLARAGKRMLVLERREQLGGACTLERPFADERYVISPCAYVVGLLDASVISELELGRHGYRATPADPNLWVPLSGGGSYAAFIDPERTAARVRTARWSRSPRRGSASRAATSSRAGRRRSRGGSAGWRREPGWRASTCAGPRPTPAAR